MQQTDKTAGTRAVRNAIAIAMAILGFLGAADGWAAEAPTGPAYTNSLGMRFVRFEPVTFTMGVGTDLRIVDRSLENWKYLYDNQPAHAVTLTAPFYVVTDRISKAQFDQAGLGAAPADGRVSWDRATAFCAWLSSREGLAYRLPTEAEWEYVCRNTGTVKNVQTEWVGDWHGAYRNVSLTNPVGPATGVLKVIRHNEYKRGSQVSSVESSAWFRVVLDTAPATRFVASPLPFNQMAVKQSTAPALQGPDPAKPYFAVRFALPIPPDNDRQFNGSLLGVDPAVVDHNHSPGFEIMPNGDALAIWFSGANGSEYGSLTRIVQARLRYGAEEFDMPELLFHTKDQNISPCQWREGTTNWLFTGWGKGQGMGKPGDPPRFRVSRSTDSGATWTMTVPSPKFSSTYGFPQPINSAFRGPNGAMYVAADGTADLVADKFGDSLLWQSMDNGLTWTDQGGRTIGYHSTIVPLDQTGRLLSIGGRPTDINGYMPQNISTDWGVTWQAATQSPFPRLGGNQRPSMCRLASGKLVMVGDVVRNDIHTWPADWPHGKTPYVALSDDNGTNWYFKAFPVALNHETQAYQTLGYVTVRQAPNGLIHVLTSMTHPCIHYEFNEAWVNSTNGDMVAETSGGTITNYSETYPSSALKTTWSARICPNGRYLLDGVETNYYENGVVQRVVIWASGRRTGEETLWAANGEKFWSWNHDLANNVSTWTHWWSNGRKRLESLWNTNPTARDLPSRRFRGLVANGTARNWDSTERQISACIFSNGTLISEYTAPSIWVQPINVTVNSGYAAQFSVTASGTPLLYQWYRGEVAIGGATASSYTMPATTTNDSGATFKVTVTNAYGAVTSSVATLMVNDPFEVWRQANFTAAQLTNSLISGATADPDYDGLNNQQEYWAGTNPTNALSCLVLYMPTNDIVTGGKYLVRWQSVSGKTYAVQATTNLLVAFTNIASNIPATPTMNVHTDNVGVAGQKFYRVKTE